MKEKLQHLLNQYANATATPEEEEELWSLVEDAKNDDTIKSIILSMLTEDDSGAEFDRDHWSEVLRKVLDNTDLETNESPNVFKLYETKKRFNWKYLAAAAIVIIMMSAGIFYIIQSSGPAKNTVIASATNIPNDITPPNSVNAVLTLSNGKRIELDSAGNGMLAQQAGASVVKLSSGQIVYNPELANLSEVDVSYNTLANPAGSKAVNITLSDGSRVWLNSESSLRYPTAFVGKDRRVEITGEAYFEVNHNEKMPFHVNAKGVDVEVLGTHFNINSYDDEAIIKTTLLEGSVKISNNHGSKIIKPGEQAQIFNNGQSSISVSTPNLNEVVAWKNGRFFYNNADLESIMRQIARWYNVEVIYKDKIQYHYTVDVLRNVQVSQLFKFIEMSGGVHFDIRDRTIIVRK